MSITQTKWYRIIMAAAFGLAGFSVNFFDIQLFECPTFKVSILAGLFFPLVIALAWGWWYGLLAALAGGCQSMWWLWRTDGWGVFYAVPVFTLWIVWHGWWVDHRREGHPWYKSCFVVEIPFRILIELGFYTMFRWLVSLNPPPWNPAVTWNQVPLSWVHTVAIKHAIVAYILLLAAYAALSLGPVRRFFGLPLRPAQRDTTAIFAGAVLMGVFLWMVDALVDYLGFNPDKTFWEVAVLEAGPKEMFSRILYLVVTMIGAVLVASFTRQRVLLSERLDHQNRVLAAIRNVNQLITSEKDRDRLASEACRLLVETRGLYSAWIVLIEDSRPVEPFFHAGFNGAFAPMGERLRSGHLPECARMTLRAGKIRLTEDPAIHCPDCPLALHYDGRAGVTLRLEHRGKVYGLLCASVSASLISDTQEQILIEEVGDDIAFALYGIEMEQERKRVEEERNRILSVSHDLICIAKMDGYLKYVNPAWERLLGYSTEEFLTRPFIDFIHPDDHERNDAEVAQLSKGVETIDFENRYVCKDGSIRHILWTATPLPDEKVLYCIGRDITERKRGEEELRQHREHLKEMVEERTAELRKMVNLMAGREVRMAELKEVIRTLRTQLEAAGLSPAADDPLLGAENR